MPKLSARELSRRARSAKVVLMDVDGVLTSGHLFHFVDPSGKLVEFKGIHAQDSIALAWLAQAEIQTGLISGRISEGVAERAKMLKMTFVYQHRLDKKNVFDEICREAKIDAREAVYIGDDLPDLPVIGAAGIGVAVRNARPEVKAAAHWVTRAEGGQGAVREVVELILRAKGLWRDVVERFRCA